MIDLYMWPTPNGRKVSIMLEETGLPYTVHTVDIRKGEPNHPGLSKINPNNRIPAIFDRAANIGIMESGAILVYLGEKTGKFFPLELRDRMQVMEWLMWQMGNVGPMFGQVHHFVKKNKGKSTYAEGRFLGETQRLYGVLNKRLGEVEFVAGKYSIADISIWPWVARFDWQTINLNDYPNVKRWYVGIAGRPAVKRGYNIPENIQEIPMP